MGQHQFEADQPGRARLILSGEFSLADAPELKQAMVDALNDCGGVLALHLDDVSGADLTFFQLLFALSAQAQQDGKGVELDAFMPDSLARRAEELGLARRDFEHVFYSGAVR